MAARVENRDDDYHVSHHSKDDAVREAVNKGLAKLSEKTSKRQGVMGNALQGFFQAEDKVGFQIRIASAIPFFRLRYVSLGAREQFDTAAHFARSRSLTSGQVDVVMPPDS